MLNMTNIMTYFDNTKKSVVLSLHVCVCMYIVTGKSPLCFSFLCQIFTGPVSKIHLSFRPYLSKTIGPTRQVVRLSHVWQTYKHLYYNDWTNYHISNEPNYKHLNNKLLKVIYISTMIVYGQGSLNVVFWHCMRCNTKQQSAVAHGHS